MPAPKLGPPAPGPVARWFVARRVLSRVRYPLALCAFSIGACSAGELGRAADSRLEVPQPAAAVSVPPLPPPARAEREGRAAEAPSESPTTELPSDEFPEATEGAFEPELLLIATGREAAIHARPNFRSQKIGYLRAGARVRRGESPEGREGCKAGWYRIMPEGFVCTENAATIDPEHPVARLAGVMPDRSAGLPFRYGRSRYPTPPLYARFPSELEQQVAEIELRGHLRAQTARAWEGVPSDPVPELLLQNRALPTPHGYFRRQNQVVIGRAMPDSGFALLGIYEQGGRRYALSTDFELLPLDRLKPVEASAFHGLALGGGVTLPVAFVRSRSAYLYAGAPKQTGLSPARKLAYREAVPISGRQIVLGGLKYYETAGGDYLREENLVVVDPLRNKPGWATGKRTWVHVSILRQTLVAYEGETPVYVTLVSTGIDGLGDPAKSHSTVRGQFLVHTKHVTTTMDSDAADDPFDLRDVPYVQYFHEGYALHAAYWHDSFGQPYSHGCVNLSPLDARWLFHWTDPPVPRGWHGALSLRGGTLVHITP
jgi:hypothetical protein